MKKLLITLISAVFVLWWISQGNYTVEQQDAYYYAYSQKITTVSSIEKANMDGQLTRIAMAKMISNFAINVLWLQPDISKNCSFSDVSNSLDAQYNYGVTQVCQLWLMWVWNDGKKSDKFDPYATVTRAQFATAFSRALSKANWDAVENGDPYYSTHLAYLQSEWIIKNTSTPSPSNIEKRWNVMIMMKRASSINKNVDVKDTTSKKNASNKITDYDWVLWVEVLDTGISNRLEIKITNKTKSKIQIDGIHLSSVTLDNSIWVYQGDNTMQPEYLNRSTDKTVDVKFWYPAELNQWDSTLLVVMAEIEWSRAILDNILFSINGNAYVFSKDTSKKTEWNKLFVKNDWNSKWITKNWAEKTYYDNWQLHEVLNYKDGKLNWEYISYYYDGKINAKWQYKDNEKTWEWIEYFEDGSVASKWSYKNWKLDWYWIWYCEKWNNNCTSLDGNYKDWKQVRWVEEYWNFNTYAYYSNKQVQSAEFQDNNWKRNWDYVSFYENGQLKEQWQYKNDKKSWEWVEYFEDGSVKFEWTYKDWELEGYAVRYCEKWKESQWYYKDGKCITWEWDYKNWEYGWAIREAMEQYWIFNTYAFWSNEQVQSAEFQDNNWKRNWDYVSFYENGQLKEQWQYKNDKKSWEWIEYFEDGSVASKWSYKDWKLDWYRIWYCEKWDDQCTSLDWNYEDWEQIID